MIRLLNIYTLRLSEFHEDDTPMYAIASHRWQNDEATFKDALKGRNQDTAGFAKIRGFCDFLKSWPRELSPLVEWLWIDTCCIDTKSSAELSEAINSMFNWYAEAEFCIAYLYDIEIDQEDTKFETSEWFSRGWTLQELIAPSAVIFLDKAWDMIGHKNGVTGLPPRPLLGAELNERISRRTGIVERVLHDRTELHKLSVAERLSWMDDRKTRKLEDQAYCLLGIFNVNMPLIYGERQQAKIRLLHAILQKQVWTAEGFHMHQDHVIGITGDTEETTQICRQDHSNTLKTLKQLIMELEVKHGSFHEQETARNAKRRQNRLNALQPELEHVGQQIEAEMQEKQKAQNKTLRDSLYRLMVRFHLFEDRIL